MLTTMPSIVTGHAICLDEDKNEDVEIKGAKRCFHLAGTQKNKWSEVWKHQGPCGTTSRRSTDYVGYISSTTSGKKCQKWSEKHPHSHQFTTGNVFYTFPKTTTSEFVHGLCVMGASTAQASITDSGLQYSVSSKPFGNDVVVWGDSSYKTSGVSGKKMCEGGTFLQPSKHKVSKFQHI